MGTVQPFQFSAASRSHRSGAPQEWGAHCPPVDTTLRADGERSWVKGKRSEGSYEGAPACPDQALAGSVSCFGVVIPLLPISSSLHAGGRKRAQGGQWTTGSSKAT